MIVTAWSGGLSRRAFGDNLRRCRIRAVGGGACGTSNELEVQLPLSRRQRLADDESQFARLTGAFLDSRLRR
jgi:hypothetical protein